MSIKPSCTSPSSTAHLETASDSMSGDAYARSGFVSSVAGRGMVVLVPSVQNLVIVYSSIRVPNSHRSHFLQTILPTAKYYLCTLLGALWYIVVVASDFKAPVKGDF